MYFEKVTVPTYRGGALGTTGPVLVEYHYLKDEAGNIVATFSKEADGTYNFNMAGANGLRCAHAKYDFAVHGGAQSTIAPLSDTIPDNAILVGGTINSTTAVLSGGAATVAIGTSAGSSTTSIKTATGKASYSVDAVLNVVPVFATPVKMTAAGTITFTIGAADLTAGVIEAWVLYVVALA
jgi:hypothetical protein